MLSAARPPPRVVPSAPRPELKARQADAVAAYSRGNLAEAGEICRQILSQAPDFPPALYLLGLIAGKSGDNGAGNRASHPRRRARSQRGQAPHRACRAA